MKLGSLLDLVAGRAFLTTKDLALLIGVTERTIRRWRANHELPPAVIIHGPRWRPSDIDRWLKSHEDSK